MKGELLPAAVAAGGGTALATGIFLHERREVEAMRASRVRLAMRFPMALETNPASDALAALSGLADRTELIFETTASMDGIKHAVYVPASVKESVASTLSSAMPGLRLNDAEAMRGYATLALRVFVPTPTVLQVEAAEIASRSLLAGLAGLQEGEQVALRWALRPRRGPAWEQRGDRQDLRAVERAWSRKTAEPGFSVTGLVLVQAGRAARARELAQHLAGSARSRRRLGRELRVIADRAGRSLTALPKTTRTSGWLSAAEALPLLGWPLGRELVPGVEVGASRELLVPRHLARDGRPLFIGRGGGGERPVALSPEAARHHVAIVGPSGSGKSAMLAHGVLSDIERGFGGVLVDPKSDLIQTILDRVPERHANRIVALDPADPRPVPGIGVLSSGDPDLRADVVLGALRAIFRDSWGIRSDVYGRLAIRTLSEVPGSTLADVGRLFFDTSYRRRAVARLNDPLLIAAWQGYESLSPGEQAQRVQAPMNKVLALIGRPAVRRVLAQAEPKVDIGQLLTDRKWLMVSLAPGKLGEPASRLVGAVVMFVVWSAIEARVALPPEARKPVFLYVDELSTLASLPFGFELLAERARGLGAGLTVALQTLGRLPESTRSALLGNVATLITFRAGADEAARLARELPGLTALDLQSLDRFEVAGRVGTGSGSAVRAATGRTIPLPLKAGQADKIRAASSERYGGEPPALDEQPDGPDDTPLGRTRRAS